MISPRSVIGISGKSRERKETGFADTNPNPMRLGKASTQVQLALQYRRQTHARNCTKTHFWRGGILELASKLVIELKFGAAEKGPKDVFDAGFR